MKLDFAHSSPSYHIWVTDQIPLYSAQIAHIWGGAYKILKSLFLWEKGKACGESRYGGIAKITP
jgi:hypothetical protein